MTDESPPRRQDDPRVRRGSGPGWKGAVLLLLLAYAAAAGLLAAGLLAPESIGLGPSPGDPAGLLRIGAGAFGLALAASLVALWTMHAATRRAEARNRILSDAFASLPTPRLVVDDKGAAVFVSPHFHHIFDSAERTPLEALAERFAARPGSAQDFRRLQATAAMGVMARAAIEVPLNAGESEWYEITACPIAARPGYVMWRIEDVTAQRELEQVIRQEHETLFDFLEQAPVGFYSVNEDGRFLFINQTFAEWLGFRPEEILGGNFRLHDFVGSLSARDAPPFDPFGAGGLQENGEVTLKGREGRVLQAFITQIVVPNPDGAGLRTRSVVRDLTPEREWQKALWLSERRFKRFFEDAPVGIALVDSLGKITECNRALRRIAAPAGREVLGLPVSELIADEDRAETEARLARIAAGSDMAPFQVRLQGDPERVASLFISRVEDAAGGLSGLILHFLDITEFKKLETRFAQSQKMQAVGQLAGGIAHDFNNLLTAMIGFCDLLLLRHGPGEQSFADIMQIKQNANRAANLVRQLLAFSRQQPVQPKILNVTDVLADISNLLRRLIGEKIELRMVHGRDLAPVKVDQGQLEQVIVNLAVNARDAMPKGGVLTVRTSNVTNAEPIRRGVEEMPPGDYVLIEVGDTGVGIPKAHIDRIFEPFYSTKEIGAGTGLGLSTVHGIVKQAEGYIFVDSVVGQGTKFSIFLPRHRQAEGEALAGEAAEPAHTGDLTGAGTILLVEDEDAVRLFSARALRNKGYKVLEAKGGETAIELLKSLPEPVDLLITDIVMPDMDGPALVEWVREREPAMRVICISGYAEETFHKRLDAFPGIRFLAKPFSLEQLAGTVKEAMAERADGAASPEKVPAHVGRG